ncbi:MAG: hypothetical protein CMB73_05620 [Euryarchaeota archaeon]|nr:hypothetical protein [Euryarchaeota archaeon]
MIEELTLVCLLLLIIAQGLLIKGCFGIKDGITGIEFDGLMDGKFDRMESLLDEAVDVLADIAGGAPSGASNSSSTGSPMGDILTSLISNTLMPQVDAPQESQWTIQEENPQQVEVEINELA